MDGFTVTVPGPFPSVNHMYGYINGRVYKKAGVEAFQVAVAHLTRLARPSSWQPGERVRLHYDFRLSRPADCDNLQKAINDAIADALGVNDSMFLPCVRSKVTGAKLHESEVVIEISNEAEA